ncbi:VOC family protein [Herbiconiux sp. CPCC 205763]|uniref:VOC family protein n=1 Tax=Herbiconiux aconitum TaxID=2970913 RepID=A0ABT2GWH1_9MICO|nr:VOC family protein [Herbiconiux aconitum]MCS5719927.1 VOC family protein [Herbiconiux aconitum]
MLSTKHGFSGFSVRDIEATRAFYTETLGLKVSPDAMGILEITLPGGASVIAYPKDDHVPATFTVLNLVVDDIDVAIDELAAAGVSMQHYDGMEEQDEKGVLRGRAANMGPDIAWFLDPSGNVLSVLTD